ncbi:MAG: RND transporter [Alphaproteobacteria bacterium]|nr:RND transporter [Alphaproteobacteria bacterium]
MQLLSTAAVNRPKSFLWGAALLSVAMLLLAGLPSLAPKTFAPLHPVTIDTDPENMLDADEPVRVFHNAMKKEFGLWDIVVVGVINENHPQGAFNAKTLSNVHALTEYAKTLRWTEGGKEEGVVPEDIIAPSTVDNVEQGGIGDVKFEWLMRNPPATDTQALDVARKAERLPFLKNTLVSDDGKALALYIPITSKDASYRVSQGLKEKISTFESGGETYHITGLPVAQDTFGVEMFKQMAISAPMAMALIFALMWYFFRSVKLILSPMVVALVSVIVTMGALVATGHTVHIMSSMIPIFIMPIAVLDAVHILSDFFDRYPKIRDRRKTLEHVMNELSKPMLFTTLTTAAGFGSLAFTPIPPVQVFGMFISLGVLVAWLLTITLIPAWIMLMSEKSLENFGLDHPEGEEEHPSPLARLLRRTGSFTYNHARIVVFGTLALAAIAVWGISLIRINDNPVKWFEQTHEIRVADRELNERFAGTYMAYLTLSAKDGAQNPDDAEIFKNPDVLRYIEKLQGFLLETGKVGKSNALPDIVKTVHRELLGGETSAFRIPDSRAAVAQVLLTYQNSHRPDDLWNFVTPDFGKANLWIQLKSGDNIDMNEVVDAVDTFFAENPPPVALTHDWYGLTYINVIWQDKMVAGMVNAFLGSFVIVLLMMVFLFRSVLWGALSMVPLTVTIAFIYGVIGMIGKDYDMPVAVLSSLSLGLAVDYAIHFLARSREMTLNADSWKEALPRVFGEPARAIARNVIIIGVGFLPLLLAPLVPYKTVGFFISAILLFAGAASLLILPSLITLLEKRLFKFRNA